MFNPNYKNRYTHLYSRDLRWVSHFLLVWQPSASKHSIYRRQYSNSNNSILVSLQPVLPLLGEDRSWSLNRPLRVGEDGARTQRHKGSCRRMVGRNEISAWAPLSTTWYRPNTTVTESTTYGTRAARKPVPMVATISRGHGAE